MCDLHFLYHSYRRWYLILICRISVFYKGNKVWVRERVFVFVVVVFVVVMVCELGRGGGGGGGDWGVGVGVFFA